MAGEPLDNNFAESSTYNQNQNNNNNNGGGRRPHNNHQHSQNREGYGPSYEREFSPAGESCPTRNSVLVLSVVCGMLLLMYIASAVCFMAKNRPWRGSSMGHGHHKHIIHWSFIIYLLQLRVWGGSQVEEEEVEGGSWTSTVCSRHSIDLGCVNSCIMQIRHVEVTILLFLRSTHTQTDWHLHVPMYKDMFSSH